MSFSTNIFTVVIQERFVSALNAQLVKDGDELAVERLIATYSISERYVDDLIVAHTDHDVALSLHDSLDSADTGAACEDTVAGRWATAALQVSEN